MMDEHKVYKVVETMCDHCGKYIRLEANFVEHRCECGHWIPLSAFCGVKKEEGTVKTRTEKRREELYKIYGVERNDKCLESDFEECFWDGYDKGYAKGYAVAKAKTHIISL